MEIDNEKNNGSFNEANLYVNTTTNNNDNNE